MEEDLGAVGGATDAFWWLLFSFVVVLDDDCGQSKAIVASPACLQSK